MAQETDNKIGNTNCNEPMSASNAALVKTMQEMVHKHSEALDYFKNHGSALERAKAVLILKIAAGEWI